MLKRVRRACLNCRSSKVACDQQRPCTRCVKQDIGHSCYDLPRKKREKKVKPISPPTHQSSSSSSSILTNDGFITLKTYATPPISSSTGGTTKQGSPPPLGPPYTTTSSSPCPPSQEANTQSNAYNSPTGFRLYIPTRSSFDTLNGSTGMDYPPSSYTEYSQLTGSENAIYSVPNCSPSQQPLPLYNPPTSPFSPVTQSSPIDQDTPSSSTSGSGNNNNNPTTRIAFKLNTEQQPSAIHSFNPNSSQQQQQQQLYLYQQQQQQSPTQQQGYFPQGHESPSNKSANLAPGSTTGNNSNNNNINQLKRSLSGLPNLQGMKRKSFSTSDPNLLGQSPKHQSSASSTPPTTTTTTTTTSTTAKPGAKSSGSGSYYQQQQALIKCPESPTPSSSSSSYSTSNQPSPKLDNSGNFIFIKPKKEDQDDSTTTGTSTSSDTDSDFEADIEDEVELPEIVDYSNMMVSIAIPVTITMLLVILLVRAISLGNSWVSLSPLIQYNMNGSSDDDSQSLVLTTIVNSIIFIAVIVLSTVIMVVLYKFRFMKALYGWLMGTCILLLGVFGGFLFILVLTYLNLPLDYMTFVFVVWNFSAGAISALMALFLSRLPEWTTWAILVIVSVYDLFAVLCPGGPLKMLVETAQKRGETIPALIYNASVFIGMAQLETQESAGDLSIPMPTEVTKKSSNLSHSHDSLSTGVSTDSISSVEKDGNTGINIKDENNNNKNKSKGIKLGLGDFIQLFILVLVLLGFVALSMGEDTDLDRWKKDDLAAYETEYQEHDEDLEAALEQSIRKWIDEMAIPDNSKKSEPQEPQQPIEDQLITLGHILGRL
eukprot:gene11989-14004_t